MEASLEDTQHFGQISFCFSLTLGGGGVVTHCTYGVVLGVSPVVQSLLLARTSHPEISNKHQ